MAKTRILKAINEAIREEMERDNNVIVLGEDVVAAINGLTTGLYDQFGSERVINTPIAESVMTGMCVGAAMKGLRPILEYGINTLQYVGMEMLVNQATKLKYMTGGQISIPMVVMVSGSGAGTGMAAQHSDSTWAQLIHMGMKVVVISSPESAKDLMTAAIRDDDPVVVYVPALVYGASCEKPEPSETIDPLGKGVVKREGTDLTVVATAHLVANAMKAAEEAEKKGYSVEVIDPQTLFPLDVDLILKSVRKTGRLLVCDDGYRPCSFASEVAAIVAEEAFDALKAPIKRVTRPMVFVPYSKTMEKAVYPAYDQVVTAIDDMLDKNTP